MVNDSLASNPRDLKSSVEPTKSTILPNISSSEQKKNTILVSALKKTKSYSLMGHYKDISPHLK